MSTSPTPLLRFSPKQSDVFHVYRHCSYEADIGVNFLIRWKWWTCSVTWFILNYELKSGSNVKLAGRSITSLQIALNWSELEMFCAGRGAQPKQQGFGDIICCSKHYRFRDKSSSCASAWDQKCCSRAQGRTMQRKTYFRYSSTFSCSSSLMESYYLEDQLVPNTVIHSAHF